MTTTTISFFVAGPVKILAGQVKIILSVEPWNAIIFCNAIIFYSLCSAFSINLNVPSSTGKSIFSNLPALMETIIMKNNTLTFLNVRFFDAATNQRVVSSLVSYNVEKSRHLSRMSERNLGNISSLKRPPILHWSITIQEITMLLSW